MFERFTTAARRAVVTAQQQAREARLTEIGAADLLAGVLADRESVPARVLAGLGVAPTGTAEAVEEVFEDGDAEALGAIGVDLDAVRRQAEQTFGEGAFDRRRRQRPGLVGHRVTSGHVPLDRETKQALVLALREAVAEHHRHLGPEHLFLGLLATEEGTALRVLRRVGVQEDVTALRRLVLAELARAA